MERTEIRAFYASRVNEWLWLGSDNYDMTRYPHNIFLELPIRFGVILGSVVALAILYSVARSLKWLFTDSASKVDA